MSRPADVQKKIDDKVTLVVRFTMPDGEVRSREFTWGEVQVPGAVDEVLAWIKKGPPAWLAKPSKAWPTPQGPITFSGEVRPGHEADAEKVLNL